MITENLEKWVEENKIIISESSQGDSDIITIDGVGKFLFVHPFDGNVIDEDFGIILSDEELVYAMKSKLTIFCLSLEVSSIIRH